MVAMNNRTRGRVWLALSIIGLAGLLISRSLQPDWLAPIGLFFLSAPILATLLTDRLDFRKDPATASCIVALVVLFGLTLML